MQQITFASYRVPIYTKCTWVESSNVDKVSCWRTKSARHWRESNPEPFDPESRVQSNIPPRPVLCGIPQGSILGPLLFILHINDLPAGLKHCKVSMYADDTLLYCEGTDLNEICIKVNEDLHYVKTWLDHNKLSLNVNKTEYMLLGTRNRLNKINDNDVDIKINGKQLKRVRKCKHLGIIIDENLTWQDHVTNVQKKSGTGLYMLKTVKPYLDRNTLQIIYNAIVSSHLNYCDIVWDNCGVTLSNKLQKIQNRGARIINDTPWHSSGRENLTRLNWQSLENKREDNTAKMMFRILNNRAPPYLSDKFSYTEHRYNTRQSELNVKGEWNTDSYLVICEENIKTHILP